MMTVNLGITTDDKRTLNKSFAVNYTANNVHVKDNCSVLNPVITFQLSNIGYNFNYMYIPEFGRYYFIDDIRILTGNRVEVTGSVDVLMSYRESIRALTVNVSRQADAGKRNPKISDSAKPLQVNTATDTYVFNSSPFTNHVAFGSYILTVLGGGH